MGLRPDARRILLIRQGSRARVRSAHHVCSARSLHSYQARLGPEPARCSFNRWAVDREAVCIFWCYSVKPASTIGPAVGVAPGHTHSLSTLDGPRTRSHEDQVWDLILAPPPAIESGDVGGHGSNEAASCVSPVEEPVLVRLVRFSILDQLSSVCGMRGFLAA